MADYNSDVSNTSGWSTDTADDDHYEVPELSENECVHLINIRKLNSSRCAQKAKYYVDMDKSMETLAEFRENYLRSAVRVRKETERLPIDSQAWSEAGLRHLYVNAIEEVLMKPFPAFPRDLIGLIVSYVDRVLEKRSLAYTFALIGDNPHRIF